ASAALSCHSALSSGCNAGNAEKPAIDRTSAIQSSQSRRLAATGGMVILGAFTSDGWSGLLQRLGDKIESVLAEKHFIANKENWRTECAARHGGFGFLFQLLLGGFVIGCRQQSRRIKAGRRQ